MRQHSRPKAGGLIEDLPLHFYEASGGTTAKIPTEALISDRREFELSELGFVPLAFYKSKDYACFFSANSIQEPQKYTGKDADYATANARLSSRLALSLPGFPAGALPQGHPAREHRHRQGSRRAADRGSRTGSTLW